MPRVDPSFVSFQIARQEKRVILTSGLPYQTVSVHHVSHTFPSLAADPVSARAGGAPSGSSPSSAVWECKNLQQRLSVFFISWHTFGCTPGCSNLQVFLQINVLPQIPPAHPRTVRDTPGRHDTLAENHCYSRTLRKGGIRFLKGELGFHCICSHQLFSEPSAPVTFSLAWLLFFKSPLHSCSPRWEKEGVSR